MRLQKCACDENVRMFCVAELNERSSKKKKKKKKKTSFEF